MAGRMPARGIEIEKSSGPLGFDLRFYRLRQGYGRCGVVLRVAKEAGGDVGGEREGRITGTERPSRHQANEGGTAAQLLERIG